MAGFLTKWPGTERPGTEWPGTEWPGTELSRTEWPRTFSVLHFQSGQDRGLTTHQGETNEKRRDSKNRIVTFKATERLGGREPRVSQLFKGRGHGGAAEESRKAATADCRDRGEGSQLDWMEVARAEGPIMGRAQEVVGTVRVRGG
ncbi:hypothetical protein BDZ91DRAFT_779981 [Kalaharituber pfeilii]|nr:hypothetical protein BDZ91DRAFT_779981 [Kalaharituber pfeilii]